jgi:cell wall-associated NlpC family hydrolase
MGLALPRRADEQARAPQLREVHRNELQPGDLVFFNTLQRTFSHVGIYVGDGRFIHAPRTGSAVRIESMAAAYWARRYTGARRPAGDAANP